MLRCLIRKAHCLELESRATEGATGARPLAAQITASQHVGTSRRTQVNQNMFRRHGASYQRQEATLLVWSAELAA